MSEIALPFDGTIELPHHRSEADGGLFALTGWLDARGHLVGERRRARQPTPGITPKPPIDVSSYQSRRLFATAQATAPRFRTS